MTTETKIKSAKDLYGPEAITRASHNVPDLLPTLDEATKQAVIEHYSPRSLHHLFASRPGDTLFIPLSSAKYQEMLPLINWIKQNTGIEIVIVPESAEQLPIATKGKNNPTIVSAPYYMSQEQQKLLHSTVYHYEAWGPSFTQAELLKNKRTFHEWLHSRQEQLNSIAQEHGLEGNVVMPFQITRGQSETVAVINSRLQQIHQMYEQAGLSESYPVGVIVRLTLGDGAYGTFFVTQKPNGHYSLSYEKQLFIFDNWDNLATFLEQELTEAEYIITRLVDVAESPSNGVYLIDGKAHPLPITSQLMVNGSCVGGSSINCRDHSYQQLIAQYTQAIQALSTTIVQNTTDPNQTSPGHLGFDYIIGGPKEAALRQAVTSNPNLAPYQTEVTELLLVECNPRFTSLSLTVWPIVIKYLYEQLSSGEKQEPIVTLADIALFYGQTDEQGRQGGFAVWDFVEAPSGINNNQALVDWINRFNLAYANLGIFIVPRITISHNEQAGKFYTSVGIGLKPTADKKQLLIFQKVVQLISQYGLNGKVSEIVQSGLPLGDSF